MGISMGCTAGQLRPLLEQVVKQQQRTNELLAQLADLNLPAQMETVDTGDLRARWDKIGAARKQEWDTESQGDAPVVNDPLSADDPAVQVALGKK